jgi:hypothetical protein
MDVIKLRKIVLINRIIVIPGFDHKDNGIITDAKRVAAVLIGQHHIRTIGYRYSGNSWFAFVADAICVEVVKNYSRLSVAAQSFGCSLL